ncbi:uncharacterized protein LOC133879085 [Alnus glutinosa]|uniref:uncharacterized protein LOC133879085 n=1 Tax=Alnus glutinosa TaxID=3517 RepID=UPI002D776037|nr:uncharacterized protein LOC133879085 [Alnus glutinosa]
MPEGSLPVRYLGVRPITKRLSAFDCEVLVAKISGKIDSWLVRNLSFAGYAKAKAKVAWEKLCCPKSEVGLRLKRLEEWNCAAMLKHIWSLFAQSGSIWVAWVDSYWLKRRSLWNISIPKVCSLSWKKLLNLRKLLRSSLALKWVRVHLSLSGSTSGTQLVDFLDTYGFRIVYAIGRSLDAQLSFVIKNGKWSWLPARSDALVEIQNRLFDVYIGDRDIPVWSSKNWVYSCTDTWNCLRTKFSEVPWCNVV